MFITPGVADGVGGWRAEGVDSSHFSSALMSSCANVVRKQLVDMDRPVDILTRAMRESLWLKSNTYGEIAAQLYLFMWRIMYDLKLKKVTHHVGIMWVS